RLDPKSLRDVQDLAARLSAGEFVGRDVMLIGFTDSIGQFDLNRALAVRRAQGVFDEILGITGQEALNRSPVVLRITACKLHNFFDKCCLGIILEFSSQCFGNSLVTSIYLQKSAFIWHIYERHLGHTVGLY
ncbi:MAG: hypothetical protein AAF959_03260, partial [Cyanobacteria bacterium P01_D01_bin.56]